MAVRSPPPWSGTRSGAEAAKITGSGAARRFNKRGSRARPGKLSRSVYGQRRCLSRLRRPLTGGEQGPLETVPDSGTKPRRAAAPRGFVSLLFAAYETGKKSRPFPLRFRLPGGGFLTVNRLFNRFNRRVNWLFNLVVIG